jgi:hypothetical protein
MASAPGASSTAEQRKACTTTIAPGTCDLIRYDGPPRCFFGPGSKAVGKGCAWHSQCAGRHCEAQSGSLCGTCGEIGQVGDGCTPTSCAAGLACVLDSAAKSYRCIARAKAGEACTANSKYETVCAHGLVCAGNQRVAAGDLGAACRPVPCNHDIGLDCHKQTKLCTAIPMGAPGASCNTVGISNDTYRECRDGLCVNRNDRGNGTCMAYAADGAACDAWSGPACRPPARCVAKTCAIVAGAQCN